MGERPADRVKTMLGKLDTKRRGKERGYNVANDIKWTSGKFAGRVEKIFKTSLSHWNGNHFTAMSSEF